MQRRALCLLVISLLLASCGQASRSPFLPTATSAAQTAEAATSTRSPYPTTSPTRITHIPPTLSSTPSFSPLSEHGPWLAALTEDRRVVVADFDNNGLVTLPSPSETDHPCEAISSLSAAPRGGLISFRCRTPSLNLELWILSLPTGKVLSRLPLLGEEATRADAAPHDTPFPWPPPAQYAVESDQLMWSQSGRFLAYSAAPASPSTDVYVYDSSDNIARRLTSGPDQTRILGWSPDDRWIIHASFLYGEVDEYVKAIWAVSNDGATTSRLYNVDGWILNENIVGWESNNEVLTERSHFEACDSDLRSTVIGGQSQILFSGGFYSATYDPFGREAIIAQSSQIFCTSDTPGLFAVNTDTRKMRRVSSTPYWWVSWSPSLAMFVAKSDADSLDIVTRAGAVRLSLPNAISVDLSPDGQWLLAHSDGGVALMSSRGDTVIGSIPARFGNAAWHPDSSELAFLDCPPCSTASAHLLLYTLNGTWELRSARELPFRFSSSDLLLIQE